MKQEIAVLLDKDDKIATASAAVYLVKYVKQMQNWRLDQRIEIRTYEQASQKSQEMNLNAVRNDYFHLIEALGECRILVGKRVRGVMFSIFSSVDYLIMETDNFDEKMLDTIYDSALQEQQPQNQTVFSMQPQPLETPGEYYFDFQSLKRQLRTITSRQTIQPFLRQQSFQKLTILCDHKMPWLDEELEALRLLCTQEKQDDGVLLVIRPAE